jgi:hypothetical protein
MILPIITDELTVRSRSSRSRVNENTSTFLGGASQYESENASENLFGYTAIASIKAGGSAKTGTCKVDDFEALIRETSSRIRSTSRSLLISYLFGRKYEFKYLQKAGKEEAKRRTFFLES